MIWPAAVQDYLPDARYAHAYYLAVEETIAESAADEAANELWMSVIEDLEAQLAAAGPVPTAGWVPPALPGPLPEDLVERAVRLAQAQAEVVEALRTSLEATAGELAALAPARATASAVYLDVMG
ncbi:hypothetical protein AL755_00290 (plasmid) [Arthrobacter sp. ERGS1:01]|uniref:hypothetical protein n=1 Tax=Arthrobacter sp. ERGS1:01 TaxID=1704044 RepID=UPI0006B68F2E|nr:hypothetical protein [Arthrobacter sp. ERGS1:01]ALE04200.1 hypothetical protein AL755_00290 [Arthrobacter sp. ERGS1:01]